MNALRHSFAALAAASLLWGCGEGNVDPEPTPEPQNLEVGGQLSGDTVWEEGSTVTLTETVYFLSGTLTLEPGVTVKANPGAALVITRNARIDAQGTAEAPITFTSSAEVGNRKRSDWAGLVMLGNAPINVTGGSTAVEGFADTTHVIFGGTDAAHDCGTLRYARIQFAGYELSPGKEVNSLTLAGCGSGTEIDYVQTHRGSDDGIEIFGGSVDLKHVVITLNDDDALDWDFGWTGRAQYLVIQTGKTAGNFGFEAASSGSAGATPKSLPTIWNLTMIGSKDDAAQNQVAMLYKEDTGARVHRALVAYFYDSAIDVTGTSANEAAADLYVRDSIFFDNAGKGTEVAWGTDDNSKDSNFDELAWFSAPSENNRFVDPLVSAALNETAPNFQPAAGSPALTSATGTPADPFFETNGFVGAVGETDWTAGWTEYPAN